MLRETDPKLASLLAALVATGFDAVGAGPVAAYHARVPETLRLPRPVRDDHTLVLVGASRAMWPPFLAALAREPTRRTSAHPLDTWARAVIAAVARHTLGAALVDLYHYDEAPPRLVALQHLAVALGLGSEAPCGLVIHPTFGLWWSMRAAIVVDLPSPPVTPPPTAPCATCDGRPCVAAQARALTLTPRRDHAGVRAAAAAWLAVRDACPVARDARYSEGQIRWHYLHDRTALAELPDHA